MPDFLQPTKKNQLGMSRHVIKFPEQEEQQKLSYQTNKLAQYIELQLSDLENTLHYIQKKHSINQIKQSISHSYNIFSETQPIFRQLRINFIYDKIKKLVNCFSIIYLILIEHIEKPSRLSIESDTPKNNDGQNDGSVQQYEQLIVSRKNTIIGQKKKTITHYSQITQFATTNSSNGVKKPKPLGGIHLYNQQYNRHIESDLDRLKRKLKEQAKQIQESSTAKISQKQRLKEQIFKEINTDIYGSPSPDQLTLFFNLNSNRYGSELQYITFQDELQQIAAFFKESQDQALQFLNKSRDDFIFLNFNQGFKEMMVQYKVQKEEQVNGFVGKVKNLFQAIKSKTIQRQSSINHQIIQLKKLQQKISKPITAQIQTQTSFNFQEEISRLKKKIQELETNYNALQNYHKNQNQTEQKTITFLEHKIAFKDHQISLLKKQLDEKSHFIDFLNDKINNGTDPKVLRKISNLYRNHSKKNSSKLKIELQQLQKEGAIDISNLKNKNPLQFLDEQALKNQKGQHQGQEQDSEKIIRQGQKRVLTMPLQDYEKPNKKKRKQGISFFASPEKRFTSYIQRNASFNLQNNRIQEENSQMQKATSADIPLYEEQFEEKLEKQNQIEPSLKKEKQTRNLVKNQKRQSQGRNSLQLVQKSKSKNYEPKRSAFAQGLVNNKLMSSHGSNKFGVKTNKDSMKENISEESVQDNFEEEELLREIAGMRNNEDSFFDDDNQNQFDPQYNQSNINPDEENDDDDELEEYQQNAIERLNKKRYSQNLNRNQNAKQYSRQEKNEDAKNLEINAHLTPKSDQRNFNSVQSSGQNNQLLKNQPFKKKQSLIQNPSENNTQNSPLNMMRKGNTIQRNSSFKNQQKVQTFPQKQQQFIQQNQQNQNKQKIQLSKAKVNKFSSQQTEGKQNEQNVDLVDQNDKTLQNQNDEKTRFFKTLTGFSDLNGLNSDQKDSMISTYFTTIYKESKIKSSNLHSRLIDIQIKNELPKSSERQLQKKNKNQVLISVSNKEFTTEINRINYPNNKSGSSKVQDVTSIRDKGKYLSSESLSDFKKNKGKLSQLCVVDSLVKFRDNKTISQNLIDNLETFKEINTTQQLKEQEDGTQRQNKQNNIQVQAQKVNCIEKKPLIATDYQRIYGISSTSWNRNNKRQTSDFSLLNHEDKQKMEEYLEKTAIKAALKSKNVEEFKAKIKKMHLSRCGQSCKHLERYLQNFNKYRASNRQILKIHIQNVNHSLPQDNQTVARMNKQNSVTLPSISILNSTGFSAKGFGSVQRNIGTASKK